MAHSSSGSRSQECEKKSSRAREAIGNEIMSKTFRRKEELGRYKFITPHILEEIWTDELLADLFAGTELSGGSWLPRLKDGHLKILSILVVISWSKWDQFKDIFINHPGRTDQDLPLDESAIDGTYFDKAQLEKFVESQSRFLPTTIIENRDIDCRFEFQMPFETQPKRISEKGSYSSVEKVVIVSGHYEDRERGINVNSKELIRKICFLNDPNQDLTVEKDNLKKLRTSLFDDPRVMTSLGTMTYLGTPRTLSIFFPVAEFDLDDYLFGKESRNSICEYPVNPADLMQEFACLAHALNYLHNDIRLDDGVQWVCVHHDLKPDNILVVADGSPVGCWKVTDFGLSRVKQAESKDPSTVAILYDHVSSVRASLTSPKRQRGTFQPPEIERAGEKVMGPKSDIWALGCILCLVLEYAIGGPPAVEIFQNRRLRQKKSYGSSASYEHDYFYRGDQLNPEVLSALEETTQKGEWAQNCVEIIKKTLQIDPAERPEATLLMDWLFKGVVNVLRKKSPNSTSAKPSEGYNEINQVVQQSGHENLSSRARTKGTSPVYASRLEPSRSNSPDVHLTSPQPPDLSWTPYPSLRPDLSSGFVTFKLENIKQTSLSHSGDYVAFLCEGNVYVHSIALLEEHGRWENKQSNKRVIRRGENTLLVITPPRNTVWKAMSFPGPFLALRGSNTKEKKDYACVFALTLSASMKAEGERVYEQYPISNLLGVVISVKGDLVLQFSSSYEYRSRSKNWEKPSRCTITGLKNVVFTLDGDSLLGWSDGRNSMYSHFWATKDLGDDRTSGRQGSLREQPNQAVSPVDERMIPHFALPAFVLFDERPGRVRNIQGQIHPPREQLTNEYYPSVRAGVVAPVSNAIVLARQRNKPIGAVLSLSISTLTQDQDGFLQLQNPTELYESEVKIYLNNRRPCDIAIRVGDDSGMIETIFISYLDGTLEKIECSSPQA